MKTVFILLTLCILFTESNQLTSNIDFVEKNNLLLIPSNSSEAQKVSNVNCPRTYTIKRFDTCISIIVRYFASSIVLFQKCNRGFSCFGGKIKIGRTLCICSPPKPPPQYRSPPRSPSPSSFRPPSPSSSLSPPPAPISRVLFLNLPVSQVNKNKYFRYASYSFANQMGQRNWNLTSYVDHTANLNDVEDQGECNAGWAMAAGAAFESIFQISTNLPLTISKQQLLDCSASVNNNGSCGGGWPTNTFEYMVSKGIAYSQDYPYTGNNQKCNGQNDSNFHYFNIATYEQVDFYGSFGLILAVQNQPVIVNVQASSKVFQQFTGKNVFDSPDCFTNGVDHSVLVVGYNLIRDESNGFKPYWIIRNSWGKRWGDEGYMRIAYTGGEGICGMHTTPAYYPVLLYTDQLASPCGPPNPCGGGTCSLNSMTGKNLCKCPPTFIAVENKDKTQTCAPLNPCKMKTYNPCGYGTCVDDLAGSYTCICPPGFVQDTFANSIDRTCAPSNFSKKQLFYSVQTQNDCELIRQTFRINKQKFLKQNPFLNCINLKVWSQVNVTHDATNWKSCKVSYSWNAGDSCNAIQSLFKISRNNLLKMNPDLNCNNITVGMQLCVQEDAASIAFAPPCGQFYTVQNGDTCQNIIQKKNLDPFSFFFFNRGINCQLLVPKTSTNVFFDRVCVDAKYVGPPTCSGKKKFVFRGDTCEYIVFQHFKRNFAKFKECNKHIECGRGLVVGTPYCIC